MRLKKLVYAANPLLTTLPLDVAGWVMGQIKQCGLIEVIDQSLPKTSRNYHLSHGQVAALLLVKLAVRFPCSASLLPMFAARIPMAAWLEDSQVEPAMFNRFVVASLFKAVAEYGTSRFFSLCAATLLSKSDLSLVTFVNLDSTSIHSHGKHYVFEPLLDPQVLERLKAGEDLRDEDLAKLEITYGYSRDNRPQDRQINLIMATT